MAQLPACDVISMGATTNLIAWTTIIADSDWWILEADVAPGPGASDSVQAMIAILSGPSDLPSGAGSNNGTNSFTSASSTFPKVFKEVLIGNPSLAPPLITLETTINQEFKHLLGAIPLGRPPLIERGQVLLIAAKNLAGTALKVLWNVNVARVTTYSKQVSERYMSGSPNVDPTSIGVNAPPVDSV